jgi:Flp pilus assembly CpaE family ATPase
MSTSGETSCPSTPFTPAITAHFYSADLPCRSLAVSVLCFSASMELPTQESQCSAGLGVSEASGPVYAIVPAHGGSNADSVARRLTRELSEAYRLSVLLADFCSHGFRSWNATEALQRLDGRTWSGLVTPGDIFDTLEAREADPRHLSRLLDYARTRYHLTCADLSEATESSALELIRNSDSIFLIANSDAPSVEQARDRAAWLRSMGLDQRTGLLLNRVDGGVSGAEAEDRTGLPVCATLDQSRDLQRLAEWLAAPLLPDYVRPGHSELAFRAKSD